MMSEVLQWGKSDTIKISELLNNIRTGRWSLWLPSIQRTYVWDSEDIKAFFESLVRRYPVGTLMLWKPEKIDVADPFAIPIIPTFSSDPKGEKFLIVDGQQRLVSLLLLASDWKLRIGPYFIEREPVLLNTSTMKFEIGRRGNSISSMVRVLLKWSVIKEEPSLDNLSPESINKLRDVIGRMLDYELPYYVLKTTNDDSRTLREMAEIFILANRAGQRISNVELMLSYSAGALIPKASTIIRKWYNELQSKCTTLDIQPVIRFGFGVGLELKQKSIDTVDKFKSAVERLAEQVNVFGKSLLEEGLNESLKYFDLALDLCTQLIGKAATELLPSQISLIPLAAFLKTKAIKQLDELDYENRQYMREWLLLVNFHGYYSGNTSTKLQKDIDVITKTGAKDPFPFHILKENISKHRSGATEITKQHVENGLYSDLKKQAGRPYLFLLYTALCISGAGDWTGAKISSLKLDKLHKHRIFPYDLFNLDLVMEDEGKLVNGIGNITLINPSVNEQIQAKKPTEYLRERSREDLESHFIPSESSLWELEKFEEFCEQRVEKLYTFLMNSMPRIFSTNSA